jgi:hypothetical protein
MNLMTLVRLVGMLVIGWTAIALGAGVLGVRTHHVAETAFYLSTPSHQDVVVVGQPDCAPWAEHRLLDRSTGRTQPLGLPEHEAWSLLSVGPWRDQNGNLQAVGRWVSRAEGNESFCGLGLLKLPGATVVKRLPLEVLPTGKPCWVPGHPGEVLFAAGDGKLYRCNVAGDAEDGTAGGDLGIARNDRRKAAPPRPMMWESEEAGSGVAYLADPLWSAAPALRHLVFVTLSMQKRLGNRPVNLPFKLWWLRVDGDGDSITAAGRLTRPESADLEKDEVLERMPNVVLGAGGKISLVYLSRSRGKKSWKLRSADLEVDPATAQPRTRDGRSSVVGDGLALSSLVVSADGKSVYGLDACGGLRKQSIPQ